jgi:hypothetical protein
MALTKAEKERRAAERAALREDGASDELEQRADTSSDREQDAPPEDAPPASDDSADDAEPAREAPTVSRASVAALVELGEDSNAWVYEGDEDLITQEIGGNVYDFRKGAPVNLPPGQSPTHDDIHEVK